MPDTHTAGGGLVNQYTILSSKNTPLMQNIILPLFWTAMILFLFLGKISNISVSRLCEYRADAAAAQLLRDPLSLAENLYIMGTQWRGSGAGYAGIESIFILNPENDRLDEKEGFLPTCFQPIRRSDTG